MYVRRNYAQEYSITSAHRVALYETGRYIEGPQEQYYGYSIEIYRAAEAGSL